MRTGSGCVAGTRTLKLGLLHSAGPFFSSLGLILCKPSPGRAATDLFLSAPSVGPKETLHIKNAYFSRVSVHLTLYLQTLSAQSGFNNFFRDFFCLIKNKNNLLACCTFVNMNQFSLKKQLHNTLIEFIFGSGFATLIPIL